MSSRKETQLRKLQKTQQRFAPNKDQSCLFVFYFISHILCSFVMIQQCTWTAIFDIVNGWNFFCNCNSVYLHSVCSGFYQWWHSPPLPCIINILNYGIFILCNRRLVSLTVTGVMSRETTMSEVGHFTVLAMLVVIKEDLSKEKLYYPQLTVTGEH